MTHAYEQSAYLATPYSFEAVKNSETEQLRPLSGVKTFYQFNAGLMDTNEVVAWIMPSDVMVESLWVGYPGSPGGTITIAVFNPLGQQQQNLIFNTSNNGQKFDNAWAYSFDASFAIPKGWSVRIKSSVAITGVTSYAEPCLFFDSQFGVRVT